MKWCQVYFQNQVDGQATGFVVIWEEGLVRRRSSFRILSVKMTVEAMEVTTNDKEKEKEKETETEKKDPDTLSLEGKY